MTKPKQERGKSGNRSLHKATQVIAICEPNIGE